MGNHSVPGPFRDDPRVKLKLNLPSWNIARSIDFSRSARVSGESRATLQSVEAPWGSFAEGRGAGQLQASRCLRSRWQIGALGISEG